MATQRSTTIFLLLLVCVASSFSLNLESTLQSKVDNLKSTTEGIIGNGLPQICILTIPIAGAVQNLFDNVPTRDVDLNGLLTTVSVSLTGNLEGLKGLNSLPQTICSALPLPTGLTNNVLGGKLASGLPELSGFTRTLDGTVGRKVDETVGVTRVLNLLPGAIGDVKSDVFGVASTTKNILLSPVADVKQDVESAAYTAAGVIL